MHLTCLPGRTIEITGPGKNPYCWYGEKYLATKTHPFLPNQSQKKVFQAIVVWSCGK